jgi:hypothetical protein
MVLFSSNVHVTLLIVSLGNSRCRPVQQIRVIENVPKQDRHTFYSSPSGRQPSRKQHQGRARTNHTYQHPVKKYATMLSNSATIMQEAPHTPAKSGRTIPMLRTRFHNLASFREEFVEGTSFDARISTYIRSD